VLVFVQDAEAADDLANRIEERLARIMREGWRM
jgi:hypothetical protein